MYILIIFGEFAVFNSLEIMDKYFSDFLCSWWGNEDEEGCIAEYKSTKEREGIIEAIREQSFEVIETTLNPIFE